MDRKILGTLLIITGIVIITSIYVTFYYFIYPPSIKSNPLKTPSGEENVDLSEILYDIGYIDYVDEKTIPNKTGVIYYDKRRAYDGLNFYAPQTLNKMYLTDMNGDILHTWRLPAEDNPVIEWAELTGDGSVYVITISRKGKGLFKLDWDSNILWSDYDSYHHDITISEKNYIYTLVIRQRNITIGDGTLRVQDNAIKILDQDGSPIKEVSLYDLFEDHPISERYKFNMRMMVKYKDKQEKALDPFHANTIEMLDRNIGIAYKGELILGFRHLRPAFVILDVHNKKISWSWGKELLFPHHPTILPSNNILLFDNGDLKKRAHSMILELNPYSQSIVWNYTGTPPDTFFSMIVGGNQRLPNGNTLITESTKGRAFEVTKNGEIVWDFLSPDRLKSKNKRALVTRLTRYPKSILKEDIG